MACMSARRGCRTCTSRDEVLKNHQDIPNEIPHPTRVSQTPVGGHPWEGILGTAVPVYPGDLTDAECAVLAPLYPDAKPSGRPTWDILSLAALLCCAAAIRGDFERERRLSLTQKLSQLSSPLDLFEFGPSG